MTGARRILVLTAGYGEGHNSAARALTAALNLRPGVRATTHDPMTALGDAYEKSKRRHLALVTRTPALWWLCYHLLDRLPLERLFALGLRPVTDEIVKLVRETGADTVVSTYPLYPTLLTQLERRGLPPIRSAVVVTDSITVNRVWSRARADLVLCADRYSARLLRRRAAPVVISGFPVSPEFDSPAAEPRPAPGEGIPIRLLLVAGSVARDTVEMAVRLAGIPGTSLTVTTGHDQALGAAVTQALAAQGRHATVLGWTRNMATLLRTHHVVLGKAGGATTHETFAARTPFIITRVLPGQEEGNASLVERLGVGEVVETPDEAAAAVSRMRGNNAQLWHERVARLERLTSRSGALRAAAAILAHPHDPAPRADND